MKAFYYILSFFLVIFLLALWESMQPASIIFALTSILKWVAIVLSSIAFFVITKPFELLIALRSLRMPEGFVFSLGIGFRFIPIIFETAEKILVAQKARGLHVGKGIRRLFRLPLVIKAVVIPLIIEILNRLWLMWIALMVRGFELNKRNNPSLKWSMSNIVIFIYSLIIILLSFVM
jgi:energy-coupling factor transport system permease protein